MGTFSRRRNEIGDMQIRSLYFPGVEAGRLQAAGPWLGLSWTSWYLLVVVQAQVSLHVWCSCFTYAICCDTRQQLFFPSLISVTSYVI